MKGTRRWLATCPSATTPATSVPVTAPDYMLWLSIQHAQDDSGGELAPPVRRPRHHGDAPEPPSATADVARHRVGVGARAGRSPRADYELRKALRLARFIGDAEAHHHAGMVEEEGQSFGAAIEASGGNYELEMAAKLAECRNVDKWRDQQKAARYNRGRTNAPERPQASAGAARLHAGT